MKITDLIDAIDTMDAEDLANVAYAAICRIGELGRDAGEALQTRASEPNPYFDEGQDWIDSIS